MHTICTWSWKAHWQYRQTDQSWKRHVRRIVLYEPKQSRVSMTPLQDHHSSSIRTIRRINYWKATQWVEATDYIGLGSVRHRNPEQKRLGSVWDKRGIPSEQKSNSKHLWGVIAKKSSCLTRICTSLAPWLLHQQMLPCLLHQEQAQHEWRLQAQCLHQQQWQC